MLNEIDSAEFAAFTRWSEEHNDGLMDQRTLALYRSIASVVRAEERARCYAICSDLEIAIWREYKTTYSKYDEGRSDGAGACADAIKAEGEEHGKV